MNRRMIHTYIHICSVDSSLASEFNLYFPPKLNMSTKKKKIKKEKEKKAERGMHVCIYVCMPYVSYMCVSELVAILCAVPCLALCCINPTKPNSLIRYSTRECT